VDSSVRDAQKMLESFEGFARRTATGEYLAEILEVLPKKIESQ